MDEAHFQAAFRTLMYSRVCSEHFAKEDFRTTSQDWRGRTLKLKKLFLAENATPSVFPSYPTYKRNSSTPQSRSEAATSTSRLARENEGIVQSIVDFESEDTINDLSDLKTKFSDDIRSFGFTVHSHSTDVLLFVKFLLLTSLRFCAR